MIQMKFRSHLLRAFGCSSFLLAVFTALFLTNQPQIPLSAQVKNTSLPAKRAVTQSQARISFGTQILPILQSSCFPCHSEDKPQGELRLDSEALALKGGASGLAILPGHSQTSLLLQRIQAPLKEGRMPPAGDPLTRRQIALIKNWIDQGAPWSGQRRIDFSRDIQPILQANCHSCHAGAQPKGQLNLDLRALAMKGGISGPVILPGKSVASRLMHRVLGEGGEQRMPLKGTALSQRQIALLRRWIDQGAVWPESQADGGAKVQTHWAYVKPVRPSLPAVKNMTWARNAIDHFILARLEREGLSVSPEAGKETLIRRVTLDLTGLPPTLKEVDDFLADPSPTAYETVVERLLASPHYGERWARPWLDLARYADTNGFEADFRRSIWKYRDWVINALNQDMPFDQFTVEQIAGDMLPNATPEQKIATGFHRNTMFNEEGGVDREEAHWEVLVDRVNTTATVWLGSTLACAQCHNHKYDPFTQKEFYQFMAFFSNTQRTTTKNGSVSFTSVEPSLEMPTPEQEGERKELTAEITRLEQRMKEETVELKIAQDQWEKRLLSAAQDWTLLEPARLKSSGGSTLVRLADGSVRAEGENPESDLYEIEAALPLSTLTAFRLEALPDPSLPRGGPGRDPYGNFWLSDFEVEIVGTGKENAQPLKLRRVVNDNGTIKKEIPNDGSHPWLIDASREDTRLPKQAVFILEKPCQVARRATVKLTLKHESQFYKQGIGRFRLSVTDRTDPETVAGIPARLRPFLASSPDERSKEQREQLQELYRTVAPALEPARRQLAELRKKLESLNIASTLVLEEQPSYERPSSHLRIRGSFLSKGEQVFASVPSVLQPLPENQMPNRLGLARWLVSEDNPLTARVTINRIWEQYFSHGLVETSEDFGTQGERPTHPELLDWLATEFTARKWSLKSMHRLIATSAAYRQSSSATAVLLERDPYNRLLARGPRFRMEAEMIRDMALSLSGLLSPKTGGPSVFPPQPEGIWDQPYNDDRWVVSDGPDRYRRGLYTFIRRTSPYPSFVTFDAPSREFCTVRRVRTNTPLQALTLLNDPAFFEAAKSLARRIIAEGGPNDEARAAQAFRICLSRRPQPAELSSVVAWYRQELARLKRDPEAAGKIIGAQVPAFSAAAEAETAAWTMVSNVLLNLDETISKE